jgi:hypothetical protein
MLNAMNQDHQLFAHAMKDSMIHPIQEQELMNVPTSMNVFHLHVP